MIDALNLQHVERRLPLGRLVADKLEAEAAALKAEGWKWIEAAIDFPDEGPYTVEKPMMEVYASQFDWRVRYPDASGNFQGADVIEVPYDITVPVDTKVVLRLMSRDVLHSFFVPKFRLKQDAVPGMVIPVWFEAEEVGSYDLICAELCGWGHYKMAGKIHVLAQDEYERWLAEQRKARTLLTQIDDFFVQ